MNVTAVVVSVRVGADDGLMTGEMLQTELLSKLLRPVNGQSMIRAISGIEADDIVVAFYILPFQIFAIAEICSQTGNRKIFVAAVQGGDAVILSGNEPAVFVQGGLHGKLVMLEGEIGLECSEVLWLQYLLV